MKFLTKPEYYGIELEVLFPTTKNKRQFIKSYKKRYDPENIHIEISIDRKLGTEIALPPLTLREITEHEVWSLLKENDAYVDDTCGVHISLPRETFKEEDWHKLKEYWDDLVDNYGNKFAGRWPNMYSAAHDYEEWCGARGSFSWRDKRRIEIRSFAGTTRLETILNYIKNINIAIDNFLNHGHKRFMVINHLIEDYNAAMHEDESKTRKQIKRIINIYERIIDSKYKNMKLLIRMGEGIERIKLLNPKYNDIKERVHEIFTLKDLLMYSRDIKNLPTEELKDKAKRILEIIKGEWNNGN